ncbi:sugar nucleotide-binding protein [bacterium]|nr:sugar nucleotide-binding protein [bacterium]
MDSVLIVGVESIAGAGLATALSATHRVSGLASEPGVEISQCRTLHLKSTDSAAIEQHTQTIRPDWIIFCGRAARSSWDRPLVANGFDDSLAIDWAKAAARCGAGFTMLSSDAVFAGPWMSHTEEDEHFSSQEDAVRLRDIETAVLEAQPEALIIRTNVFGWSPYSAGQGFAEQLLAEIDRGIVERVDFLRHASPVLASDLGVLVRKAYEEGLCGTLHLGGAERMSPYQFAERLCAVADRSAVIIPDESLLSVAVSGRDRGETTLDCSAARGLLGVSMPLIEDGLSGFLAQRPAPFGQAVSADHAATVGAV